MDFNILSFGITVLFFLTSDDFMCIVFKDFFMQFIYPWCYFFYNTVSNYFIVGNGFVDIQN